MKHNWILDVLTDLKNFAAINGLPDLAAHLDDTHRMATVEIEQLIERPLIGSNIAPRGRGPHAGRSGARYRT
ncbi:hypothetical protein [Planktotalea sp.]|uniref:hypothetical protein n=1 Tax=Planktotalea sp. TaxID=2029877 RepID=UPI003D6C4415